MRRSIVLYLPLQLVFRGQLVLLYCVFGLSGYHKCNDQTFDIKQLLKFLLEPNTLAYLCKKNFRYFFAFFSQVTMSYLEIYNENIRDLLKPGSGVNVKKLFLFVK